MTMHKDVQLYNDKQKGEYRQICELLAATIMKSVPAAENKVWHGHPVWFDDGNPLVGYSVNANKKQGEYVRLLFWSGADFKEPGLQPGTGKFKDAHLDITQADQIDTQVLIKWLKESLTIQWDYKNIVRHNGQLERLK